MGNVNGRVKRGTVSVEYVLLASLLASTIMLGATFPSAFGQALVRAGNQMGSPVVVSEPANMVPPSSVDDGVADGGPVAPAPATPPSEPWVDDPWSAPPTDGEPADGDDAADAKGSKCNQGRGNGSEGCDPGNSNQGDPSRSNDEGDGGRGKGKGPTK